ncbi:hypothetical protein Cni_G27490 [Canna indica]|uniref:Uncharacterized protein n=1 Tax=Canna indica TaxID=4628 RepID=A0AAQ3L0W0_9LILI|nr:hypothetical protein Cni_G27490 [Canna indica]
MMASSLSCKTFCFGDIGNGSCFFNPSFKESCIDQDANIVEDIVKGISLKGLDILSVCEEDDLMIGELERALRGILLVGDNPTTDQDEYCSRNDKTTLDEIIMEDIDKHAAEESAEYLQSSSLPLDVGKLSSTVPHAESSITPTSPKLVPALKGSRAQLGMQPKLKLSVKWAPDVYDPPVTSDSHTVKGHHRRPRAIKKDHRKQRHGKTKSYKASSYDRKYVSRKSTSSMVDSRMYRSSPK